MRTSKIWSFWSHIAVLAAVTALPLHAGAQQAPQPTSAAPPQLETVDEIKDSGDNKDSAKDVPSITIRKPKQQNNQTVEKRDSSGKVTEVKVTSGKSTYYLRPNEPAGSALPGDAESSPTRAAQWSVGEFSWGRAPAKEAEAAKAAKAASVPPPPALPDSAAEKKQ
jgi:hypothetical protein